MGLFAFFTGRLQTSVLTERLSPLFVILWLTVLVALAVYRWQLGLKSARCFHSLIAKFRSEIPQPHNRKQMRTRLNHEIAQLQQKLGRLEIDLIDTETGKQPEGFADFRNSVHSLDQRLNSSNQ